MDAPKSTGAILALSYLYLVTSSLLGSLYFPLRIFEGTATWSGGTQHGSPDLICNHLGMTSTNVTEVHCYASHQGELI